MSYSKKLRKLFSAGYQLSPEAFTFISKYSEQLDAIIDRILLDKPNEVILSIDDLKAILKIEKIIDDEQTFSTSTQIVKQKSLQDAIIKPFSDKIPKKSSKESTTKFRQEKVESDLEIISSLREAKSSAAAASFRDYFLNRYDTINNIFKKRRDITNRVTTENLSASLEKEKISLIALVYSKTKSGRGPITFELEDPFGKVKGSAQFPKNDLLKKINCVLNDSVLCFIGDWKNGVLRISDILWPDIPHGRRPNNSDEDVFFLFLSDMHVGSKYFDENLFRKIINFLNGTLQSDKHNRLGENIKYLFVAGDLVDGVGIYPDQADDLVFENIHLQYLFAFEFFEQIRSDVEIIVIPGNHDGARTAEPQTPIQREFAPELYSLDNIHILGSPAYVKAHNVEILMSHGNSIIDINEAIPKISHDTSTPAMIEMLKNRHLVPIYGKRTPIAPEAIDQLVITRIPDIFHTGHTHIAGDDSYNGVTVINSGTLQLQTPYQKSMNINPNPGLTYVVNSKNLDRTAIDFKTIQ